MMAYKKGAFLSICTDSLRSLEEDLRAVEKLADKDHLELWVEQIPTGIAKKSLESALRGREVIVHGPFIHLSLVSHVQAVNEWSLRRFNETIEFARSIGGRVVTFHAGTFPVFKEHSWALEALASRFSPFVTLRDPVVTLENMPLRGGTAKECLATLSDLLEFEKLLPETRFTLDIGHCLQNGDDFEEFLRKRSHKIEDIHLHDGICGGKAHLSLGSGRLNLQSLIRTLSEVKFEKYVGLETITHEDTFNSWRVWCATERKLVQEGMSMTAAR